MEKSNVTVADDCSVPSSNHCSICARPLRPTPSRCSSHFTPMRQPLSEYTAIRRRSAGFLCPLHHGSHIHRHGILPQHAAARPHAADDIQPVVDTIHCHGPDPRPCGVGRPHVVRRYSRGPAAAVATLVPHAARQHAICRRGGTHGPRGRRRHAVRIGGAADVLPHLRVGDGDIRHYARLDFLHLVRSRLRPTSCWHR